MKLLSCALLLTSVPAAAQTTWYVDQFATPPGSGTAEDPFPTIQAACDAAPHRALILVAPGTYSEGNLRMGSDQELRSTHGPEVTRLFDTSLLAFTYQESVEGFLFDGTGPPLVPSGFRHAAAAGVHRIVNCIFMNASEAEAIHPSGFTFTPNEVRSCTFVNNSAVLCTAGSGFQVCLEFTDSVFWNNAEFALFSAQLFDSYLNCAGEFPGFNALPGDPQFFDVATGDVHLRPESLLIGAGAMGGDIGALPFDAAYHPNLHTFCVAAPHSAGAGARMGSSGSLSIAQADFALAVTEAPPGKFGKFYYGPDTSLLAFGDGYRCVGAGSVGTFRLYPAQLTDGSGTLVRPLDFDQPPTGSGPGALTPGSTWSFQFWYRDPSGPEGTGFNLSDGLSATFAP